MSTKGRICEGQFASEINDDVMNVRGGIQDPMCDFGIVGKLASVTPIYIYDVLELDCLRDKNNFGFTDGYTVFLNAEKLKNLSMLEYYICIYQSILQAYFKEDIITLPLESKEYLSAIGVIDNKIKYSNTHDFYSLNYHPSEQIASILKDFSAYEYLKGASLSVTPINQYFKDCMILHYQDKMSKKNIIDDICFKKAQTANFAEKGISFNNFLKEAKEKHVIYNKAASNIHDFSYEGYFLEYLALENYTEELTKDINIKNLDVICEKFADTVGRGNLPPVVYSFFIDKIGKTLPAIFSNFFLKKSIVGLLNTQPKMTKNHIETAISALSLCFDNWKHEEELTQYELAVIENGLNVTNKDIEKVMDFLQSNKKGNVNNSYNLVLYKKVFNYCLGDEVETNEENENYPEIIEAKKEQDKQAKKLLNELKDKDLIPAYFFDEKIFDQDYGCYFEKLIFEFFFKRREYFLNEGFFPEDQKNIDSDENGILSTKVVDELYKKFQISENYYLKNKKEYEKIITDYFDDIPEVFKFQMMCNAFYNDDLTMKNKILSLLDEHKINEEETPSINSNISLYFEFNEESPNKEAAESIIFDYIEKFPQKAINNIYPFLLFMNQPVFNKLFEVFPEEVKKTMDNILNMKINAGIEVPVKEFIEKNKKRIEGEIQEAEISSKKMRV